MGDNQSRLILILGGARAGKSAFALRLAAETMSQGKASFIATAEALDEEMTSRIARNRAERATNWNTIEEPYELDKALFQAANSEVVIVDCLTLFVSNWRLRLEDDIQCEETLQSIALRFLSSAKSGASTVICVSNEVGLGIVPETTVGRTFRDLLGRVNQQFAAAADEVYLLVAGLPLRLKPASN